MGLLRALNQYVKHDCKLNSSPDPEHQAAVFTEFHAKDKADQIAPVHVGFAANAGCGDATQELILLRVSVVPASLKSLD